MLVALWKSSFGDAIPHVVKLRAQEEVTRAHTLRIVARVANLSLPWINVVEVPEHQAMREMHLVSDLQLSITLPVARPKPLPASVIDAKEAGYVHNSIGTCHRRGHCSLIIVSQNGPHSQNARSSGE